MSVSNAEFQERLSRISRQKAEVEANPRAALAVDRDGYFILRGAGRRRGLPWHGLAVIVFSFFAIKGLMMSQLGPDFYAQDIARLGGGNVAEKVAAWTMRPDPLSRWVAAQIKMLS